MIKNNLQFAVFPFRFTVQVFIARDERCVTTLGDLSRYITVQKQESCVCVKQKSEMQTVCFHIIHADLCRQTGIYTHRAHVQIWHNADFYFSQRGMLGWQKGNKNYSISSPSISRFDCSHTKLTT